MKNIQLVQPLAFSDKKMRHYRQCNYNIFLCSRVVRVICVGAIDGKHIAMQAPANSGSDYYTYKRFHSMVLFAVCDTEYIREGDKNVYAISKISKGIEDGSLGLPLS